MVFVANDDYLVKHEHLLCSRNLQALLCTQQPLYFVDKCHNNALSICWTKKHLLVI